MKTTKQKPNKLKYVLTFALALVISNVLFFTVGQNSVPTDLDRCMALYSGMEDSLKEDPQMYAKIKEVMRAEGHKTVQDLIRARCKYWIGNGQRF